MMSQTAARRVNVVALGFADDQGETEERPTPDPRVTSSNVIAPAATAPPMTAPHEMAEADDPSDSTMPSAGDVGVANAMACFSLSVPEKREQDDYRDRDPEQPKKNAATHVVLPIKTNG
jgi:hypothetical protein